jgi:predicted ATPase
LLYEPLLKQLISVLGTYMLEDAEPLAVYRVLPESMNLGHLERPLQRFTPFVGREHEVGLLQDRWVQTKESRGQVILLSGEAGIGKSRLVQTFTEHLAGEAHRCITWHGSPYHQQSAFYPLAAHLQRWLRFRRDDPPQVRLHTLEEALASYGFALQEVMPLFATLLSLPLPDRYPPLPLTPQRQKQKTLEALLDWLLQEAERQPVCVVMEDLHWADPSTLEFLSLLIEHVAMARLLVLLIFRPDFRSPWALRSYLTSLALGRLNHRQVESLAVQITGGIPLPPEVLQQVVATTDGVPLFVEEWIKMILESGLVEEWEGQYRLAGPLPTGAIPVTLHDLLMARLDRLASAKTVAQLGAVLGRTFSYEVLRAVTPLDEAALQQALAQLVDAELLYQRGVSPQGTYLFKHALLQEAAYQSILKRTRQQYHQRIAQVLTAHFPEAAATQPELLARHYTEAGLIEEAIPYWQQAGQQASERSAHREAISHLTTGIALLKTLPETPMHTQHALTLHIALGTALQMTTGLATPEVEHAYAQARAMCRQVGETPQHVQVLLGVWRYYLARSQFRTARELGDTLLRLAHQTHAPALTVVAHYALGVTQLNGGALAAARRHLEEGLVHAAVDQGRTAVFRIGQDLVVGCHVYAAVTLWLLGYPEQAHARLDEALALAHALAHPYSLGLARCYAAILAQRRGDMLAVHTQAEAMITLSLEQGFPQWVALGMCLRGWARAMQDHDQEGLVHIRQGIAAYRATGAVLGGPYLSLLLGEAAAHLGHLTDALQAGAEANRLVEQYEERSTEAEVYRLRGILLLRQPGTPQADAEAWLQRALDVARRQEAKMLELQAAMSLSRLWQQQGKQAEARTLLTAVYGWFTEGFDTADVQKAQALLEDLAG